MRTVESQKQRKEVGVPPHLIGRLPPFASATMKATTWACPIPTPGPRKWTATTCWIGIVERVGQPITAPSPAELEAQLQVDQDRAPHGALGLRDAERGRHLDAIEQDHVLHASSMLTDLTGRERRGYAARPDE